MAFGDLEIYLKGEASSLRQALNTLGREGPDDGFALEAGQARLGPKAALITIDGAASAALVSQLAARIVRSAAELGLTIESPTGRADEEGLLDAWLAARASAPAPTSMMVRTRFLDRKTPYLLGLIAVLVLGGGLFYESCLHETPGHRLMCDQQRLATPAEPRLALLDGRGR